MTRNWNPWSKAKISKHSATDPNACAVCFCLGYSGPFVSDTSPKSIDREGLGESRTGTRQSQCQVVFWGRPGENLIKILVFTEWSGFENNSDQQAKFKLTATQICLSVCEKLFFPLLKTLQAIKQTSSNSLRRISSHEGLTLETSAFESLYGGQFTLSTQLITTNYLVILPTDAAPQFLLRNLHPLDFFKIHYRGVLLVPWVSRDFVGLV